MGRLTTSLLATLALGALPAAAENVRCGSTNGEFKRCDVGMPMVGARLHEGQASSGICDLGTSWGYDAWGVWTLGDCRATFLVLPGGPTETAVLPPVGRMTYATRVVKEMNFRTPGRIVSETLRCPNGQQVASYRTTGEALCAWQVDSRRATVTCTSGIDYPEKIDAILKCL